MEQIPIDIDETSAKSRAVPVASLTGFPIGPQTDEVATYEITHDLPTGVLATIVTSPNPPFADSTSELVQIPSGNNCFTVVRVVGKDNAQAFFGTNSSSSLGISQAEIEVSGGTAYPNANLINLVSFTNTQAQCVFSSGATTAISGSGIKIGTFQDKIGFFKSSGVVQQPTPVVLADVINVLVQLGLCA